MRERNEIEPVWRRVLRDLERGEADEARTVLAEGDPQDPTDRRIAELLRSLLTPSRERHTADPPSSFAESSRSEDGEGHCVEETLRSVLAARRALAEGRVDDLVGHVEAAAESARTGQAGVFLTLTVASLFQAAFRFTGLMELHDRGVQLCSSVADRLDRPHMAIQARGVLATFHVLTGRLYAMVDCCEASLELAEATGLDRHPVTAMAHQFKGYALFEWNRLDEARTSLERAWHVAGPGAAGVRSGVARVLAAVASALGDADAGDEWLEVLQSIVTEPMTLRNREWLAAVRIRHGIRRKRDLRQIDGWANRYDYTNGPAQGGPISAVRARLVEYEHLMAVLEATSQWTTLLPMAESLFEASGDSRLWFAVRALTARSVALEASGRPDDADESWSEALALGNREGFVRAYLDGAAARRRLLERATERPGDRTSALRVLEAAGTPVDSPATLTPRQRETLEHVARGLSNREVSVTMGLSETTVKTHLREVYRRLQVGSRTGAVAEGRRLGLL